MQTKTKSKTQAERVKSLAAIVLNIGRGFNQTLTETKQVRPEFMAHWVDINTGKHGIENLIAKVLKKHPGIPASRIIADVQGQFTDGTTRYPASTISQYLCNSKGIFCKTHVFIKVSTGTNPHFVYVYGGLIAKQ